MDTILFVTLVLFELVIGQKNELNYLMHGIIQKIVRVIFNADIVQHAVYLLIKLNVCPQKFYPFSSCLH